MCQLLASSNSSQKASSKFLTIFLIIAVIACLIGVVVFANKYSVVRKDLEQTKQLIKAQQINEKVLIFTSFFIEKVLKAEGEVSFEDRLELENAVRDLDDNEVSDQWNKFIESKTEEDAQKEVKDLLEMLVKKINY